MLYFILETFSIFSFQFVFHHFYGQSQFSLTHKAQNSKNLLFSCEKRRKIKNKFAFLISNLLIKRNKIKILLFLLVQKKNDSKNCNHHNTQITTYTRVVFRTLLYYIFKKNTNKNAVFCYVHTTH